MTKERLQGHALILTVNLVFGINIPISKWIMHDYVSPEFYTMARMIIAGALFWIAAAFFPKERLSLKEIGMLAICSIGGIVLNQGLFVKGLSMTSPVDASVLLVGTPILVMVFSAIILKEPITLLKAFGVALGAAGAVWLVVSASDGSGANQSSILGDLITFSSTLFYAIYFVISKPLSIKYQAVTLMKWMFLFAIFFYLIPYLCADHPFKNAMATEANKPLDIYAILGLAYIFIGATFVTYLLIPMAVKRLRPTTASMYNYVQPVVSTAIAITILGDGSLTPAKIMATIMIFIGVYCVTASKARRDIIAAEAAAAEAAAAAAATTNATTNPPATTGPASGDNLGKKQ